MKCPRCGSTNYKVVDSRPTEDNERRRRRLVCQDCGRRYQTVEIREDKYSAMIIERGIFDA